ncbi:diguanylate cyclase [Ideonella sp.]|jgi:diguanylate cyclase (GGDEF)-like protein|uniref:diguanylate cyclase n=1 Tax=Ideonella sp. TaxID=1929293 RepID=UPI0037BECA02
MRGLGLAVIWVGCLLTALDAAATLRPEPAALASPSTAADAMSWTYEWQSYGFDAPERAQQALESALAQPPSGVPQAQWRRMVWHSRAMVAAAVGDAATHEQALQQLQALASETGGLAAVDRALAQAVMHAYRAQSTQASDFAQKAALGYESACGGTPQPIFCDARSGWRAAHIRSVSALRQGVSVEAKGFAQDAERWAERSGDMRLKVRAATLLAVVSQRLSETDRSQRYVQQAEVMARQANALDALAWLRIEQAALRTAQRDSQGAQWALQEARRLAKQFGSPRMEAQMAVEFSASYLQEGKPKEALAVVLEALPVVRRFNDLHFVAPLLHNSGLARLALGQVSTATQELESALTLWREGGAQGAMLIGLREHADALAQRGDARAALALYHREQALREEMHEANREASLRELRARYRTEAEQQELALLERDNAVKAARLENQHLQQRIWAVAAGLLVAALAGVVVLVQRTRKANLQLRRSEAFLRVQSERDPLTGLANRRHFRDVLAVQAAPAIAGAAPGFMRAHVSGLGAAAHGAGFEGGLLLVDVDHFKRINDEYGHAAGDAVLVELSRRLGGTVRSDDLVCRWGGEEFLIFVPGLAAESLDIQARRLLAVVGDSPVTLPDGRQLAVTASLGWARFPLPRQMVALDWEQAVNLVDMALYSAKGRGRDCAAGLTALSVSDAAELSAVEQDFEAALNRGQVALAVQARDQADSGSPKQSR